MQKTRHKIKNLKPIKFSKYLWIKIEIKNNKFPFEKESK